MTFCVNLSGANDSTDRISHSRKSPRAIRNARCNLQNFVQVQIIAAMPGPLKSYPRVLIQSVIPAASSSRTPPSRPRASARSLAPASRPGLGQPRIPEDRKERSASAVRKRIGPALAIVDEEIP